MKPRPPGLLRLITAVAASAAVLTLLATAGVPATTGGLVSGSAGCLAVAGVVLAARDGRDLASALLAVACGIGVGGPMVMDSCSPVGILIGPIVGIIARTVSRLRQRGVTPPIGGEAAVPGKLGLVHPQADDAGELDLGRQVADPALDIRSRIDPPGGRASW